VKYNGDLIQDVISSRTARSQPSRPRPRPEHKSIACSQRANCCTLEYWVYTGGAKKVSPKGFG